MLDTSGQTRGLPEQEVLSTSPLAALTKLSAQNAATGRVHVMRLREDPDSACALVYLQVPSHADYGQVREHGPCNMELPGDETLARCAIQHHVPAALDQRRKSHIVQDRCPALCFLMEPSKAPNTTNQSGSTTPLRQAIPRALTPIPCCGSPFNTHLAVDFQGDPALNILAST